MGMQNDTYFYYRKFGSAMKENYIEWIYRPKKPLWNCKFSYIKESIKCVKVIFEN